MNHLIASLRAAGAALLLLALLACAFDQTQVPPLADELIPAVAPTPAACDGSGRDACPRDEPTLADFGDSGGVLTGTWARRLVLSSERETRGEGQPWYDSTWTVYELVKVLHDGTRLREVSEVCEITMAPIDGAQTGFPCALIDSLPLLAEEGDLLSGLTGDDVVGATYENPEPLVRLFGLAPEAATKPWQSCLSYFDPENLADECPLALWPEIVDMDCDGNVGVTLDMTVGTAATEQVFMVQRDTMTRTGTVLSPNRIAGDLTFDELNANLGSTKAMLKSNPPSRALDGATFVMVRLKGNAGCGSVRGAAFDL